MHSFIGVIAFIIMVSCNETVGEDMAARIVTDIHSHKVVMYSKSYCPYSQKLKQILSLYPIKDFKIVELDKQEMKIIQAVLKRITGRTTVPQLFVGGEFVGGYDETHAIDDRGGLQTLLESVDAL